VKNGICQFFDSAIFDFQRKWKRSEQRAPTPKGMRLSNQATR
jgi:hypothetical protein